MWEPSALMAERIVSRECACAFCTSWVLASSPFPHAPLSPPPRFAYDAVVRGGGVAACALCAHPLLFRSRATRTWMPPVPPFRSGHTACATTPRWAPLAKPSLVHSLSACELLCCLVLETCLPASLRATRYPPPLGGGALARDLAGGAFFPPPPHLTLGELWSLFW